jgi:hypothetical protein
MTTEVEAKFKLKWRVADRPTGRYRSFERRGWPNADYENGKPAAMLRCQDEYVPKCVKDGDHGLIEIYVADHSGEQWRWRKAINRAVTLDYAKSLVRRILEAHPTFVPKEVVKND